MKKTYRRALSALLATALVFLAASPAYAASNDECLRFNQDGKFTIVQFADCQDDPLPRKAMILMMEKALDDIKPDLVVFTGDNIAGGGSPGKILTYASIKAVLNPVVSRGIPFAAVFGNHDHESNVSKEDQLKMYQSFDGCLAYDADPGLYGCATYSLPILASGSDKTAFNLWMFDSNEYDEVNGGYDWVRDDQVQWYKDASSALEAQNNAKVPSMAFQHIPAPEIYELLAEVPEGTEGANTRFGKTWALELNPERAQGVIGEWPCPSNTVSGQFEAFVERGDVLGLVTGHDHVNDFVGTYRGIDMLQSPGAGFQTYGDENRGCRVIVLDENDPWNYETRTPSFYELFGDGPEAEMAYTVLGSEFATFVPFLTKTVLFLMRVIPLFTSLS